MQRRNFIKQVSTVAATSLVTQAFTIGSAQMFQEKVKCGFIGVGARGLETLKLALLRKDVVVVAICDIDPITTDKAIKLITEAGQPKPKLFIQNENSYKKLLDLDEIDAVFISTPWEWHNPMSIAAMRAGKAVACEVGGAESLDKCWQVVNAYEETQTPFMIMENVCYRRDVMAILQMVRKNLFGEMIHLEGGYQHDLRAVKFNDGINYYGGGVEFGEKGYSEAKWRTNHSVKRNADLYPTHGIGPIGSMINNNRGNRFEYLTSMASKSRGLHEYVTKHAKGGPNHPNASVNFALGDVVITNIRTTNGETITLTHDTNLPRPYSLGFRVQGTRGIWMDVNSSLYLEGKSPSHKWEAAEPYLKQHDHPLWTKYEYVASGAGHGGMDWFVLNAFIEAFKRNDPMPMDVYDHASWAAITCLSEESIANNSEPQVFPDFTKGKWENRKPVFALNDDY